MFLSKYPFENDFLMLYSFLCKELQYLLYLPRNHEVKK